MIIFDLRCEGGHVFEAWFATSSAFEDQRIGRRIECPMCGATNVEKAVMAPNICSKGNRAKAEGRSVSVESTLEALAKKQVEALQSSEWVGRAFPDRARAMHLGDLPSAPIHGETSLAEARELLAEGVPVAPLLFPVVPPAMRN